MPAMPWPPAVHRRMPRRVGAHRHGQRRCGTQQQREHDRQRRPQRVAVDAAREGIAERAGKHRPDAAAAHRADDHHHGIGHGAALGGHHQAQRGIGGATQNEMKNENTVTASTAQAAVPGASAR
jgi:hypothetical protein